MRITKNQGLLTVTHQLAEGYSRPTDEMEAEETVGQILGDLDSIESPTKRKRLLKLAMGYMRLFGLDKEKDWMAQYNMRRRSKPKRQESVESYLVHR